MSDVQVTVWWGGELEIKDRSQWLTFKKIVDFALNVSQAVMFTLLKMQLYSGGLGGSLRVRIM